MTFEGLINGLCISQFHLRPDPLPPPGFLVCYTAVFSVVRNAPPH